MAAPAGVWRAADGDDDGDGVGVRDGVRDGDDGIGRRTRRRRAARLLAVMSLAFAGAAGYFGFTILSLRSVERSWAQAMAIDAARRDADTAVVRAVADVGDPADRTSVQDALGPIGDEAAAGLQGKEDELRGRWIPDGKVDRLRDEMVAALQFRRFQLGPTRKLLGDTPLQKVEIELRAQLDRFDLGRTRVRPPRLRSAAVALAGLARFTDVDTGTVVVALDDNGRLTTLDLDASTSAQRSTGIDEGRLLAVGDLAVVVGGGRAVAYPALDVEAGPRWSVPADAAVAARSVPGVALWATVGDRVVGVGLDGATVPGVGFTLPTGGVLVGDTIGGAIVRRPDGLERRDPATGAVRGTMLPLQVVGTTTHLLVVRSPAGRSLWVFDETDALVAEVQLPGDSIGGVAAPRADDVLAFAAGPANTDPPAPYLLRPRDGARPTELVAVDGPRATARPDTTAWSADGRFLFWLTPAGRLAVAGIEDTSTVEGTTVRVRTAPLRAVVAFPSGR